MKCKRCKEAEARKASDLCGICEIVESGKFMSDLPASVPRHFNIGLGEWIEDKAHLKRRFKELTDEGKIEGGGE